MCGKDPHTYTIIYRYVNQYLHILHGLLPALTIYSHPFVRRSDCFLEVRQSWYMGAPINGGTPKWMVYRESHIKMDDD